MREKLLLRQLVHFEKALLPQLKVDQLCMLKTILSRITVLLKELNGPPIVIKQLSGRNPELAQRVASRGTFKIKKRKVSQD